MDDIRKHEPIFGNWYAEKLIGRGSFGKVYLITREDLGVTYSSALKYITFPVDMEEVAHLQDEGMDDLSITNFYQEMARDVANEMKLMSTLKGNSNIVSYEDHLIKPRENNIGYDIMIRMELLTSLPVYQRKHPLAMADVVRMGVGICRALTLCGEYNILHRDIKPDNIFLAPSGEFKLGDFGLARQLERSVGNMSRKGAFNYMAPEVYKGDKYNQTADIYSLGMVMYRLLNGNRLPFLPLAPQPIRHSDDEDALAKRISGETPLPPAYAGPELASVVMKAISHDPTQRYASPAEMLSALEALSEAELSIELPTQQATTLEDSSHGDKTMVLFGGATDIHSEQVATEEAVATETIDTASASEAPSVAEASIETEEPGASSATSAATAPETKQAPTLRERIYAFYKANQTTTTIAAFISVVVLVLAISLLSTGKGTNTVDVFDGLQVSYDGISPRLVVSQVSLNDDYAELADMVNIQAQAEGFVKNGDTITLQAAYDEEALLGKGYKLSRDSHEIVVDVPQAYIEDISQADTLPLDDYINNQLQAALVEKYGQEVACSQYSDEFLSQDNIQDTQGDANELVRTFTYTQPDTGGQPYIAVSAKNLYTDGASINYDAELEFNERDSYEELLAQVIEPKHIAYGKVPGNPPEEPDDGGITEEAEKAFDDYIAITLVEQYGLVDYSLAKASHEAGSAEVDLNTLGLASAAIDDLDNDGIPELIALVYEPREEYIYGEREDAVYLMLHVYGYADGNVHELPIDISTITQLNSATTCNKRVDILEFDGQKYICGRSEVAGDTFRRTANIWQLENGEMDRKVMIAYGHTDESGSDISVVAYELPPEHANRNFMLGPEFLYSVLYMESFATTGTFGNVIPDDYDSYNTLEEAMDDMLNRYGILYRGDRDPQSVGGFAPIDGVAANVLLENQWKDHTGLTERLGVLPKPGGEGRGGDVIDWRQVDGIWYAYDSAGNMLTGWIEYQEGWYYADAEGKMVVGWLSPLVSGSAHWFYMDEKGRAITKDWLQLDGIWYYFNEEGHMLTGQHNIDGKDYTFDENGKMQE